MKLFAPLGQIDRQTNRPTDIQRSTLMVWNRIKQSINLTNKEQGNNAKFCRSFTQVILFNRPSIKCICKV